MDLGSLVRQMRETSALTRLATNPRIQFGTPQRRYMGAEILPERNVTENSYTEENVQYRTIVANAATRYSPVQKKKGVMVGSMEVKLGESDVGSELTSRDYDVLRRLLARNASMEAMAQVIRWADTTLNRPLLEWNERARWEAIVDAKVLLRGDSDYTVDMNYSNPAGHRAAAADLWSDDTYNPMEDIYAQQQLLADKGYTVGRIYTSRRVLNILANNAIVRTRTNRITVNTSGQITADAGGRVTQAQLNSMFSEDGLPPIQLNDQIYRLNTGTGRFLADDVFVMVATTGRDETLDFGDTLINVPNVLGYTGVGVPAGQSNPGRVLRVEPFDNKPPRLEGEAWQTSLPVILEPEAIAVIHTIA
jgi:hypothetical protein